MKILIAAFALLISGCMIRVSNVRPLPSEKDYSSFNCAQLGTEKARIEAEFAKHLRTHAPGTTKAIAQLKGDAGALDARVHQLPCSIAPVTIPYNAPM